MYIYTYIHTFNRVDDTYIVLDIYASAMIQQELNQFLVTFIRGMHQCRPSKLIYNTYDSYNHNDDNDDDVDDDNHNNHSYIWNEDMYIIYAYTQ